MGFVTFETTPRGVLTPSTSVPTNIRTGTDYSQTMDVTYDLSDYVRVLKLASRPEWDEFSQVAKIAGAGIVLVGLLGFLIFIMMGFVTGGI